MPVENLCRLKKASNVRRRSNKSFFELARENHRKVFCELFKPTRAGRNVFSNELGKYVIDGFNRNSRRRDLL